MIRVTKTEERSRTVVTTPVAGKGVYLLTEGPQSPYLVQSLDAGDTATQESSTGAEHGSVQTTLSIR